MALRSGNGGSVSTYTAEDVLLFTIPNDRWSGNWRVREAEVTQSDSGGCTLYFPVVQDNDWEFSAARDDVNFPEALGLQAGDIIEKISFKLGAGSLGDLLENTLVTDVSNTCDNKGDVVRVSVRGKGGFLTPSQGT